MRVGLVPGHPGQTGRASTQAAAEAGGTGLAERVSRQHSAGQAGPWRDWMLPHRAEQSNALPHHPAPRPLWGRARRTPTSSPCDPVPSALVFTACILPLCVAPLLPGCPPAAEHISVPRTAVWGQGKQESRFSYHCSV